MKLLFLFPIVLLIQNSLFSQKKGCDLISDYYPHVYEAELNYLKGNEDLAFEFFQKAESNCALLNQPDMLESVRYAELLGKRGDYKKAFYYLKKVLQNGFRFEFLESNSKLSSLHSHENWVKLKFKSKKYQKRFKKKINWQLRSQILSLIDRDQELRKLDERSEKENKLIQYQDSINLAEIKNIFESYGYPNSALVGHSSEAENPDIRFMLMHFRDTTYLKPKLLEFINEGSCSPYVLGFFVDSYDRINGEGFTYGVYNNIDSTDLKDFQSVNKKREAIGLRNYKLEKERFQVIVQLIKKNKTNINN